MEKYHNEIVQTLVETYSDDKQLLSDILFYLYQSSSDVNLKYAIAEVMTDINRCVKCGGGLISYEFTEIHSELDNNDKEEFIVHLCPNCNRTEIEQLHAKAKEI